MYFKFLGRPGCSFRDVAVQQVQPRRDLVKMRSIRFYDVFLLLDVVLLVERNRFPYVADDRVNIIFYLYNR